MCIFVKKAVDLTESMYYYGINTVNQTINSKKNNKTESKGEKA